MTDNYRPTTGDKVKLLEGGSNDTNAKPALVDGQTYTIQQDDHDLTPYMLSGRRSFVREIDVVLVEKKSGKQ